MRKFPFCSIQRGYTLYELLITLAIIVVVGWIGIYGLFYATIFNGNFWFTDAGALRELRVDHPNVTELLKTERNIWGKSVIIVKEGEGRSTYCLDTNVLFNYEFVNCK